MADEVYGVFEGGGVRGTALVGGVAAAESQGIRYRAVAGTSAGAIVAAFLAAGYSASEMRTILMDTNFKDFLDPVSRIWGWNWISSLWRLGHYKGDVFHSWINEHIRRKVQRSDGRDPQIDDMPTPLTIVAADVARKKVKLFSENENSTTVVADAVRMSMSIPFFFEPFRLGKELIVDGGVLSNFPIWVFQKEQKEYPLPILGLRLMPDSSDPVLISSKRKLALALADTVVRGSVDIQMQISGLGMNVVSLPTLGVKTTDFKIDNKKKEELYESAYDRTLVWFSANRLLAPSSPSERLQPVLTAASQPRPEEGKEQRVAVIEKSFTELRNFNESAS